jgi:hypothetical protein
LSLRSGIGIDGVGSNAQSPQTPTRRQTATTRKRFTQRHVDIQPARGSVSVLDPAEQPVQDGGGKQKPDRGNNAGGNPAPKSRTQLASLPSTVREHSRGDQGSDGEHSQRNKYKVVEVPEDRDGMRSIGLTAYATTHAGRLP